MKKKTVIAFTIIVALLLIYFVGTGFRKDSEVCIGEYSVSEDGKRITINTAIPSSMGYIRKASVHQQGGGKLYIDFYSAFGGLNGCIGAKTTYSLPLDEDTTIIAVYRGTNCYQEVLCKDADSVWQRIK